MASLIRGVENLVVEDGEVESETQTDGVGRRQFSLRNLGGRLISLKRLVGRVLSLVTDGKLGKVAVIVSLPVIALAVVETVSRAKR
jgi:hypothetical protein